MAWREVITDDESLEFALCAALENPAFMWRSVDALVGKVGRPTEVIREVIARYPQLIRRSQTSVEMYGLIERVGMPERRQAEVDRGDGVAPVESDLDDSGEI